MSQAPCNHPVASWHDTPAADRYYSPARFIDHGGAAPARAWSQADADRLANEVRLQRIEQLTAKAVADALELIRRQGGI